MSTTSSKNSIYVPYYSEGVRRKLLDATGLEGKPALLKLLSEESTILSISKRTHIDRSQVYQALVFFGIPFPNYDQSKHMREWYASQPPETGQRLTRKAHDAVRGKKRSHEELIMRAQLRQSNPTISKGERRVIQVLEVHQIDHVPQFATDRFNIDIAIPGSKLAIEVQGGHWHQSPRKVTQDIAKREYLESQGWQIVELWGSVDQIEQGAHDFVRKFKAS